jgi:hypothetical protein
MGVSRTKIYMKKISFSMPRPYDRIQYDSRYEEWGQESPVGLSLDGKAEHGDIPRSASGRCAYVEPLLAHRDPVEEGGNAYAALLTGDYTSRSIIMLLPIFEIPDKRYVTSRSASCGRRPSCARDGLVQEDLLAM